MAANALLSVKTEQFNKSVVIMIFCQFITINSDSLIGYELLTIQEPKNC